MWQTDWALRPMPSILGDDSMHEQSAIKRQEIERVYLLHWCEHCVECAVPDCYRICPLYAERLDKKCARFRYGIYPNSSYHGLYDFGADIDYRRWGKLESDLIFGVVSVTTARWLNRLDRFLISVINPIASALKPLNELRRLNGAYHLFRKKLLQFLTSRVQVKIDEFLIEAWNPSNEHIQFILECYQQEIRYRQSINMVPGANVHRIPFSLMNVDLNARHGRILLYPDNDKECRIIFTWLDFISYKAKPHAEMHVNTDSLSSKNDKAQHKAQKIKCVVWDLDNTLWCGILVEDGPAGIKLNPQAIQLVKALDSRGIIQSLASKNDYTLAWDAICKFGLEEYFLYPAIHWGPKSNSIQQIANELNINLDTVVLIDDSAFERAEVTKALPQVRAYSEENLLALLDRPEFDVPITEESKRRRQLYVIDAKRKQISQSFGDNYEEFLESCEMQEVVFVPSGHDDIQRCLELIQRTNQLNLSTHRYSESEFNSVLKSPSILSISTRLTDKFGDYGIIGYASIDFSSPIPMMKDFVFSCRAAKRKVENAWIAWIRSHLVHGGYRYLQANFIPSSRNGVLRDVLDEIGFIKINESIEGQLLQLDLEKEIPAASIVFVIDKCVGDSIQRYRSC